MWLQEEIKEKTDYKFEEKEQETKHRYHVE